MTGDYATTDFRPETVGSNLPPWIVIDLDDKGTLEALEKYVGCCGSIEVRSNGEVYRLTPESILNALSNLTRTCHMVKCTNEYYERQCQDLYECDRCGEQVIRETYKDKSEPYMYKSEPPRYCPGCGRRCVG